MKTQQEIEGYLTTLRQEHAQWCQEAEQAIANRAFQSLAPRNADRLLERVYMLEWVLEGKPLPPLPVK